VLLCADVILRGISQVFLCNHPVTGLLVCAALWLTSWKLLVGCVLGTAAGTAGAYLVSCPPFEEVSDWMVFML
jgi:urea transporter